MTMVSIRYLSHACFEIRGAKTLLIDPFFSKSNPLAPEYAGKPDIVLVTHEHPDHADTSMFPDSLVVCPPGVAAKESLEMKIGEKRNVRGIGLEMVSSSHPNSKYPTGYVIGIGGKRLYHPGDTFLDGIKPLKEIDVFFVPIGGHYTMDVADALKALEIVRPKLAIPMHFNTFPSIKADPEGLRAKAERKGFNVKVLGIGEEIEI